MANELTAEVLGAFAGVDRGLALVWLGKLHQAGLMTTEYRWYCPETGELLLTTVTVDEAPDGVKCHRCSITHKAATECHVSLIFHPKSSAAAADAGGEKGGGNGTA